RRNGIHPFLWRDAALTSGALNLDAVLIGARQKKHVVAGKTFIAGQHIGGDGRVRMTDVRHVIDVVNGGGEIEFLQRHVSSPRRGGWGVPLGTRGKFYGTIFALL